jgi:hypothetical protein
MAITSAVGDIFASIGELFASFFHTLATLVTSIFNTITGLITGVVNLFVSTVGNVLEVFGETGKFLFGKISYFHYHFPSTLTTPAGNAFLFLIVGIGAYGYLRYQRSQGKTVTVGDKKLN